jgi:hypothetical protein
VTHGVTAACAAHGADVATVGSAATVQLSRACDASVLAPVKRPLSLTGRPQRCFFIYQDFQTPTF